MNHIKCRQRVIISVSLAIVASIVAGSSIRNPKIAFGILGGGAVLLVLGILTSLDTGPQK